MVKITLTRIRRMAAGHLGGSHCSPDNGGLDQTGKSGNDENWREPKRTYKKDYNLQNIMTDYIWEVEEGTISRMTFGYLTCTTECMYVNAIF